MTYTFSRVPPRSHGSATGKFLCSQLLLTRFKVAPTALSMQPRVSLPAVCSSISAKHQRCKSKEADRVQRQGAALITLINSLPSSLVAINDLNLTSHYLRTQPVVALLPNTIHRSCLLYTLYKIGSRLLTSEVKQ